MGKTSDKGEDQRRTLGGVLIDSKGRDNVANMQASSWNRIGRGYAYARWRVTRLWAELYRRRGQIEGAGDIRPASREAHHRICSHGGQRQATKSASCQWNMQTSDTGQKARVHVDALSADGIPVCSHCVHAREDTTVDEVGMTTAMGLRTLSRRDD
ncbi:hypothetical protein B0H19DRAFT_1068125 [Mycena capillaripes]|nr:hypothetical protein B0H19DRAFT_1068125 [Mycena capillaripes]